MSNVVMFSGTYVDAAALYRSAGPYRIATEIRSRGLSCQVVVYLQGMDSNDLEKVCEKFISSETMMVCISTTLWWEKNKDEVSEKVKQIIDYTRTKYPKAKIIFGGTCTESFIDEYDGDHYFTGYAEHYFLPFLDSVLNKNVLGPEPTRVRGNKKIYDWKESTDRFDFSSSQIIYDKSDLIFPNEAISIEVARGCIFKCKFCSYPLTGKTKSDHIKDKEILKEELIRNYEQWGVTNYVLSDDTFNDSVEKLEYLNELFNNLPFRIRFSAYVRHDLMHAFPQQIPLLKSLGLKGAVLGVETFHAKAGKVIGKGLDPEKSKDLLYRVKEVWGDDMTMQIGIITGIPYEDRASYESTMEFMRRKDCPVESFNINALHITKPEKFSLHYQSTFQIESEKYGFEWPDPKHPTYWTNSIGPVKNYKEAREIQQEMFKVGLEVGRLYFGGFSDMTLKNIAPYTQYKTAENWMAVDRVQRVRTIGQDVRRAQKLLMADYLNRLLSL